MPAPITLPNITSAAMPALAPAQAPGVGADSFQDLLAGAIRQTEQTGSDARASVERFLSGESEEVHQTILATQKAELSFEMFLQMRNKMVQAYQEVMRMQL